ncbi:hypothetical protein L5515_019665 [Caenorhabditis briggsae]|uniref:Uncharacterized protein n=1 Tax=Caenorhabditis briggsae TaxID=6238 RepID=A0AAE9FM86_CAEBR|nr:hypothetical protein L5515_019665 [Caenorhabditis briggsae]
MEPPSKKLCVEKPKPREEIIESIGIKLLVFYSPKDIIKLYDEIYEGDHKTLKDRLNEVRAEKGEGEVDDYELHRKLIHKIKKENLESSAPTPAQSNRSFEDEFYETFLDIDEDTKREFRENKIKMHLKNVREEKIREEEERKVREEEERKVREEEERKVREEERIMKEIWVKETNAATAINDEKKFGASENSPQQEKAARATQPTQSEKPKCLIPGLCDIENLNEFMRELEEAREEEKKEVAAKRKAAEAAAAKEEEKKKKLIAITTVPIVLTTWNGLIPVRRAPIVRRTIPLWNWNWNGLITVKGSLVRKPIEQIQHKDFLPRKRVNIPVDNEGIPPTDPRSSFWMNYQQR